MKRLICVLLTPSGWYANDFVYGRKKIALLIAFRKVHSIFPSRDHHRRPFPADLSSQDETNERPLRLRALASPLPSRGKCTQRKSGHASRKPEARSRRFSKGTSSRGCALGRSQPRSGGRPRCPASVLGSFSTLSPSFLVLYLQHLRGFLITSPWLIHGVLAISSLSQEQGPREVF